MRTAINVLLLLSAFLAIFSREADCQNPQIVDPNPSLIETAVLAANGVDQGSATIRDLASARGLINATFGKANPGQHTDARSFYCIIHVVTWGDPVVSATPPDGSVNSQSIKAQNWYVYRGMGAFLDKWQESDFSVNNRLRGTNSACFLYIHMNVSANTSAYHPRYELALKETIPTNLSDLFGVLQQFIPARLAASAVQPSNYYGTRSVGLIYKTSDITVSSSVTFSVNGQSKSVKLAGSQVFHNEAFSLWDVSVGVPIKKISDVTFNSSDNTVTSNNASTTNALALIDLHWPPIDLVTWKPNLIPGFVAGVAIASQPLHKILAGLTWGPAFANFYVGALFVKQQQLNNLQVGEPAGAEMLRANVTHGFSPQLSYGLNVSFKAFKQLVTKK